MATTPVRFPPDHLAPYLERCHTVTDALARARELNAAVAAELFVAIYVEDELAPFAVVDVRTAEELGDGDIDAVALRPEWQ